MKMFHPHISNTAVFMRCKHGRILKLSEKPENWCLRIRECTNDPEISPLRSFSRYGNTRYPYIPSKLAGGVRRFLPARDA